MTSELFWLGAVVCIQKLEQKCSQKEFWPRVIVNKVLYNKSIYILYKYVLTMKIGIKIFTLWSYLDFYSLTVQGTVQYRVPTGLYFPIIFQAEDMKN